MRKLITKSLAESNDEFLVKLPRHLLDESDIAVLDWIDTYKKDNGSLPTLDRIKREEDHMLYAGLETPIDPLSDLYNQEVKRLNRNHLRKLLTRATEAYEDGEEESGLFQELKAELGFLVQSKVKRAKSIIDEDRAFVFEDDTSTYLPIGIPNVDRASGGMSVGDYALMFAPQGTGKTTVLCHIAVRAALGGQDVLLVSREVTRNDLRNKIDAMLGGFNNELYKKLNKDDFEELKSNKSNVEAGLALIKEAGGNIEIPNEAAYTPANIQEMLRAKFEETGKQYDLVLVDGIYHMSPNGAPPGTNAGNDWRLFRQLSTQLMDIAMNQDRPELATRMLVTSQATPTAGSNGRLEVKDIGYAKGISQDNGIIFSIREYTEEPIKITQKQLLVEMQKNRTGVRAESVEGCMLLIDFERSALLTGDREWETDLTKKPLVVRGVGSDDD
jgi:replicative DNA helicase